MGLKIDGTLWWATLLVCKCAIFVAVCTGQNWKGTVSETKYSTPHCLATPATLLLPGEMNILQI